MRPLMRAVTIALAALPIAAGGPVGLTHAQGNDGRGAPLAVDASVRVAKTANVNGAGTKVTWRVRFTCPKNKGFSLNALLAQRDPASIPELFGEDGGINATTERTGTCTGEPQKLRLSLTVRDVSYVDGKTGQPVTKFVPLRPSQATNAQLIVQGDGFFGIYCAAPACADQTGPLVKIV